jgi:hypothetical protein
LKTVTGKGVQGQQTPFTPSLSFRIDLCTDSHKRDKFSINGRGISLLSFAL